MLHHAQPIRLVRTVPVFLGKANVLLLVLPTISVKWLLVEQERNAQMEVVRVLQEVALPATLPLIVRPLPVVTKQVVIKGFVKSPARFVPPLVRAIQIVRFLPVGVTTFVQVGPAKVLANVLLRVRTMRNAVVFLPVETRSLVARVSAL